MCCSNHMTRPHRGVKLSVLISLYPAQNNVSYSNIFIITLLIMLYVQHLLFLLTESIFLMFIR